MSEEFSIHFPTAVAYRDVKLPASCNLSEHLDIGDCPILFGCRTGICGTCICIVRVHGGEEIEPPSQDERELLELLAPGVSGARLACQIGLTAEISIQAIGDGPNQDGR